MCFEIPEDLLFSGRRAVREKQSHTQEGDQCAQQHSGEDASAQQFQEIASFRA